jgi:hypothetical protein
LKQTRHGPYDERAETKSVKRVADKSILEHERKRQVEVECLELQDKLEQEDIEEDIIQDRVEELRSKLLSKLSRNTDARLLKPHQVHDRLEAKDRDMERIRSALGISENYEEGSAIKRNRATR